MLLPDWDDHLLQRIYHPDHREIPAPESYSYQTTTTDNYGNSQPTTTYELRCVDSNGEAVKTDPIAYAFLWDGIIVLVGLIVVIGLSFALAAPAGALIARILNRNKTP